ncbi:MAG: glycosyltransferase [bacterium]|nr:glycosyltransferase [bacterium]
MKCKASIIIPVRNKLEFTQKCLESLFAAVPQVSHEIIVVDNASDDGTATYLEQKQNEFLLTWIRNDPPKPFAASCNVGARAANGQYLVFLNNDTEAYPDWLDAMVEVAERSPLIGAVGAKLLYPDMTIQHAGVAFYRHKSRNVIGPFHVFRSFPPDVVAVNKEREFQAVTGACLLTPKSVFEEVDGFDERYVNCFEDVDYCLTLREKGYKIIYTPRAVLIHHEGQTPGRKEYENHSAQILFQKWNDRMIEDAEDYILPEGFAIEEGGDGTLMIYAGTELKDWWKGIRQLEQYEQWQMILSELTNLESILGSNNAGFWQLRGKCYLKMGDLRNARLAYARSQTLDPQAVEPKWGLVEVALAETKTREAKTRINRLLAQYPDDQRRETWEETLYEINRGLRLEVEAAEPLETTERS